MRIRHHVNPLHAQYLATGAGAVPLPPSGEVEVELGCADARFLFERAAAHRAAGRAVHCVGVEIRRDLVEEVNARASGEGLSNLAAVFANINVDLEALFPDGRLTRVFINFPDPWWKRRHQKRRVMTEEVAATLHRKLAPAGQLFFQSDVFDLALDAMAAIEATSLFTNARGEPWSFLGENPFGAKSLREVRCEERQMAIWRMLYTRSDG